jgi:hypothetical protein
VGVNQPISHPNFPYGHLFLLPHGTTLTAFADVKYGCLRMLDGLVSTHPTFVKQTFEFIEGSIEMLSKHYFLSENVIKN